MKITAQYRSQQLLDILTEHLVDVRPHENECAVLLASTVAMKSTLFRASSWHFLHQPLPSPRFVRSTKPTQIVVNAGYAITFISTFIVVVVTIDNIFLAPEMNYFYLHLFSNML